MPYIDNLAGVYQTKLDALNAMDRFRMVSDLTKGKTPAASPIQASNGGSGIGSLVATGGLALLAVAALALFAGPSGSGHQKPGSDNNSNGK